MKKKVFSVGNSRTKVWKINKEFDINDKDCYRDERGFLDYRLALERAIGRKLHPFWLKTERIHCSDSEPDLFGHTYWFILCDSRKFYLEVLRCRKFKSMIKKTILFLQDKEKQL